MNNPPRCYTGKEIREVLRMSRTTFFDLKRRGGLPFLNEVRPRLGRVIRYRADLVDRYLAGEWQRRGGARRTA